MRSILTNNSDFKTCKMTKYHCKDCHSTYSIEELNSGILICPQCGDHLEKGSGDNLKETNTPDTKKYSKEEVDKVLSLFKTVDDYKNKKTDLPENDDLIHFSDIANGLKKYIKKQIILTSPYVIRILTNPKTIVITLIIMTLVLLVFPPFVMDYRDRTRVYLGHNFILSPPNYSAYIDLIRFFSYSLISIFIGLSWYFTIKTRKPTIPNNIPQQLPAHSKQSISLNKKIYLIADRLPSKISIKTNKTSIKLNTAQTGAFYYMILISCSAGWRGGNKFYTEGETRDLEEKFIVNKKLSSPITIDKVDAQELAITLKSLLNAHKSFLENMEVDEIFLKNTNLTRTIIPLLLQGEIIISPCNSETHQTKEAQSLYDIITNLLINNCCDISTSELFARQLNLPKEEFRVFHAQKRQLALNTVVFSATITLNLETKHNFLLSFEKNLALHDKVSSMPNNILRAYNEIESVAREAYTTVFEKTHKTIQDGANIYDPIDYLGKGFSVLFATFLDKKDNESYIKIGKSIFDHFHKTSQHAFKGL